MLINFFNASILMISQVRLVWLSADIFFFSIFFFFTLKQKPRVHFVQINAKVLDVVYAKILLNKPNFINNLCQQIFRLWHDKNLGENNSSFQEKSSQLSQYLIIFNQLLTYINDDSKRLQQQIQIGKKVRNFNDYIIKRNSFITSSKGLSFKECVKISQKSHFFEQTMEQLIYFFQQIEYSLELQFYNQYFQMQALLPSLFEQIQPQVLHPLQELGQLKLKNIYICNQQEIQLALTEHFLFLYKNINSQIPTHYIPLTFSLKFEVIYKSVFAEENLGIPIAIKLQREKCAQQLTFIASHPSIVEVWSLELEKKINQRNFHKLFKAKKKIGKGAFATVYLAERLRDHRMVAVKAFSKQKQYSSEKGRESLENEIKLMRMLNHTNIMKLKGVYQTENSIYVILEYLEGQQLNELLKSGKKLEIHQIKNILQSILRALSHLSKHKIIHRDLKPQNILFKKQNSQELAICDFGLATYAEQQKYLFVRCGTPGFVAPEIINIKDMSTKCDPISDVFSAGIIFHYLLFGCSVFQGKRYQQILTQNRQCELNFNKEIYSTIDPITFDLLTRMLEKNSNLRVSAEDALRHPFLSGEMDIEFGCKNMFRELTNSSQYSRKMMPVTPSAFSSRKQKRCSFEKINKKSVRPFIFS